MTIYNVFLFVLQRKMCNRHFQVVLIARIGIWTDLSMKLSGVLKITCGTKEFSALAHEGRLLSSNEVGYYGCSEAKLKLINFAN